jgi:hypothetical protein
MDPYNYKPITDTTPAWAKPFQQTADTNPQVQSDRLLQQQLTPSINSASPVTIPSTIPTAELNVNKSPLAVPNRPTNTSQMAFNTALTSATAPVVTPETPQVNQSDVLRQNTLDAIAKLQGYGARSSQLQKETGLTDNTAKLNQFQAQDLALQQQLAKFKEEQLYKNPQGLFGQGAQQLVSEQERFINQARTDLAIQKLAVQGDIKTAQDLINRSLDAEFQPLKDQIDYNKEALSMFDNDMTESQKSKLEIETKKLDRIYQENKDFQKEIGSAIESGTADVQTGNEAAKLFAQGDTAGAYAKLYPNMSLQDSGALSVILGSGKFTKDQAKSIRNAINNGEDPIAVIKNNAKQLLTGANQTKVESAEQSLTVLNDLDESLKAFYAAGGDTGIFKGNWETAFNKLGAVKDPKLVQLAATIQANLQQYRNAVSGTAYSVQEGQDIASIFPSITKGEVLNDALVQARRGSLQSQIDGAYKSVIGDSVYTQVQEDSAIMKMRKDGKTDAEIEVILGRPISKGLNKVGSDTKKASNGKEIVQGSNGTYDITSYATDPTHGKKINNIYAKIPTISSPSDVDSYITKVAPNSPVTGRDVIVASNKYGVDPKLVVAIMVQDSTLGTKGKAVRTKNPGNVGNTDDGSTKIFNSWAEGVDAVAKNLSWRKNNNA